MYQFYIVEIKKNTQGEFEHEVFWVYDADATKAQQKGESKYHEVMSRAAISEYAEHSAILFSSQGFPLMHGVYVHGGQEESQVIFRRQAEPNARQMEQPKGTQSAMRGANPRPHLRLSNALRMMIQERTKYGSNVDQDDRRDAA